MLMVMDSARTLKSYLADYSGGRVFHAIVFRLMLAFIFHRGRMSCMQAAGAVRSAVVVDSDVTRFLARKRWKKLDINAAARKRLLLLESRKGAFVFILDVTLVGHSGRKTENTYSTGNRKRRSRKKGVRYGKYKHAARGCHNFCFGILITPSGHRIPYAKAHRTKEYCEAYSLQYMSPTEEAAELLDQLEVPKGSTVYVLGDTAYDADLLHEKCEQRGFYWVVPINPSRVFPGPKGNRPLVRNRLKDWSQLSLKKITLHPTAGPYAAQRRLSKWRIGKKAKPRTYYAHVETREVHSVGRVKLVYSTMKEKLIKATPDDVKILMTNAMHLKLPELIDLYSMRWQIELFFKELKSRLGFHQYRLMKFEAVEGWLEIAVLRVLFLETHRAEQLRRSDLSKQQKQWWTQQRLHGLCEAVIQATEQQELNYVASRLKTPGGIARLKRELNANSQRNAQHAA
jgi:hypothetical protein